MSGQPARSTGQPRDALARLAAARPDLPLIAPILVYLVLLAVRDVLPYDFRWLAALLRGAGGLWAVWLFRRHLPAWGRPHAVLAAGCGLLVALGWYYGQCASDALGLPHRLPLPLFSAAAEVVDPRDRLAQEGGFWVGLLGVGAVFWLDVATRIAAASVAVPLVEELFWRAFLLRALIDWENFEKVPLGRFTWFSFLGTSLLSTLQHPDNWVVSIPCWFAFNALMYWKRSILFLVFVHGFTNLFLYAWVLLNAVAWGDRTAWIFW